MYTRYGNCRSRSCFRPSMPCSSRPAVRADPVADPAHTPHRGCSPRGAVGLAYGCLPPSTGRSGSGSAPGSGAHLAAWLLAVAAAAVLRWAVNQALVLPPSRDQIPHERLRGLLFSPERLHNDVAELCVAVLVTLGIAISPLTVFFALPFVTLLQRSFGTRTCSTLRASIPRPDCSTRAPGSGRQLPKSPGRADPYPASLGPA